MASATARQRQYTGRNGVRRATRRAADNPWVDHAARAGLAARGLVYLIFSYLVARIAAGALGQGSTAKPASGPGVAQAVAAQPGGRVVLFVLAVGLLCYALFSLLDAILHHNDESPAAKRWGDRALSAWGFVMYGAFGIYAFHTSLSSSGGNATASQDEAQKTQWSAHVLRWPAGWVWLGGAGLVLLAIALFLVSRAARRSFRPRLDKDEMGPHMWRAGMVLGTVGYLGRAGLFAVVGWFVTNAAIEDDPAHGQGVDGSIRLLANSAGGPVLLGLLAAALAGYAVYMGIEARYRRV
jgi:hypothetical protein